MMARQKRGRILKSRLAADRLPKSKGRVDMKRRVGKRTQHLLLDLTLVPRNFFSEMFSCFIDNLVLASVK